MLAVHPSSWQTAKLVKSLRSPQLALEPWQAEQAGVSRRLDPLNLAGSSLACTGFAGLQLQRQFHNERWQFGLEMLAKVQVKVAACEMSSSLCCRMEAFVGKLARRVHLGRGNGQLNAISNSWRGSVLPAVAENINVALVALRKEDVIALPSDTLYGLAGDACSATAVRRIYDIKGRNSSKPVAVCVADVSDVGRFAAIEHLPSGLLEDLLPGPVTLVLPRGENSPLEPSLNPGAAGIGIRIPDAHFIRAVARSFGGALALTSANLSGQASTVSVEEFQPLWEQCAVIFDGGELSRGRAGSTIVDLTRSGYYTVIREGSALEETLDVIENKYNLKKGLMP